MKSSIPASIEFNSRNIKQEAPRACASRSMTLVLPTRIRRRQILHDPHLLLLDPLPQLTHIVPPPRNTRLGDVALSHEDVQTADRVP